MAFETSENEPIPLADAASSWPGPPPGGGGPNWSKLSRRIWFTLGALVVCRLGSYIPIPGIEPDVLADLFRSQAGGMPGKFLRKSARERSKNGIS